LLDVHFSRLSTFVCLLLLYVSGRPLQVAVRPMLSDRCPHVLSVTLVYCGQTCGWIKMALGTEVGLGPGDIGLDGYRAPPRTEGDTADSPSFRKGHSSPPPLFGPCLLWPNGRPSQQLRSSCFTGKQYCVCLLCFCKNTLQYSAPFIVFLNAGIIKHVVQCAMFMEKIECCFCLTRQTSAFSCKKCRIYCDCVFVRCFDVFS